VLAAIWLALLLSPPGWSFTCGTFYRQKGPVGQAVVDYLITWSAINDVRWELANPVEAKDDFGKAKAEARRTDMKIALRRLESDKVDREKSLDAMRPGLVAKLLERLDRRSEMHARIGDVYDLLTPQDWESYDRPCSGRKY